MAGFNPLYRGTWVLTFGGLIYTLFNGVSIRYIAALGF